MASHTDSSPKILGHPPPAADGDGLILSSTPGMTKTVHQGSLSETMESAESAPLQGSNRGSEDEESDEADSESSTSLETGEEPSPSNDNESSALLPSNADEG